MSQIIHLHIGQAGVQMGASLWEQYFQQHEIDQVGKQIKKQEQPKYQHTNNCTAQLKKSVLFSQNQFGVYSPRSLMIDLDPMTIQQVQRSNRRFANMNCVKGKESSGSLFSRGHYGSEARQIIDVCLNNIRKQAQKCQLLSGFILQHSVSGGTGSGFAAFLAQRLSVSYPNRSKINFTIYPSELIGNQVVEPYNTVLSTSSLLQHSDFTILYQNQKIYNIHTNLMDLDKPSYCDINKTISKACSNITLPLRTFNSVMGINIIGMKTNLIPYPRIHFVTASYAPFCSSDSPYSERKSVQQITDSVFDENTFMANVVPAHGKYIANQLFYRGNVSHFDVLQAKNKINSTLNRVDWAPTGYKYSIVDHLPNSSSSYYNDKSVCMLTNSTSVAAIFASIDHKFDRMYAKRAFVHWYMGYSLQQGEFSEARQNLAALQKDFEEGSVQYYDEEEE